MIQCTKELPDFSIPYGVSAEESEEDIFADTNDCKDEMMNKMVKKMVKTRHRRNNTNNTLNICGA